jgi:hypothetical protein
VKYLVLAGGCAYNPTKLNPKKEWVMNVDEAKKQLAGVATNLIKGLKNPENESDMRQLHDSLKLLQLLIEISGGHSFLDLDLDNFRKDKERLKEITEHLIEGLTDAASRGNMSETTDYLTTLKQVADITGNTRIADIFYEQDFAKLVDY